MCLGALQLISWKKNFKAAKDEESSTEEKADGDAEESADEKKEDTSEKSEKRGREKSERRVIIRNRRLWHEKQWTEKNCGKAIRKIQYLKYGNRLS